jgi:hypothetical protein
MKNYEGKRVVYVRDSPRKGWRGTVTAQREDVTFLGGGRITVLYDNGVEQVYCAEALLQAGDTYGVSYGYLRIFGEVELPHRPGEPTHIVQGCQGGHAHDAFSEAEAHDMARSKAQGSKSGQAYRVLKIVSDYVRSEPPVTRKDY